MQVLAPRTELGWAEIIRLYDQDRVVEAFDEAIAAGLGPTAAFATWFRTLEAEAITRKRSQRVQMSLGLFIEFIPEEVPSGKRYEVEVLRACEHASVLLGYAKPDPTLVTILAAEADAPWATHPGGYCTQREEYNKICIPHNAIHNDDVFQRTVAHEYAHVITLDYSCANAPRWIEEGVSVWVEQDYDPEAFYQFVSGDTDWLGAQELEAEFETSDDTEAGQDAIWLAYQQSAWIVRFLAERFGRDKLQKFIKMHADESFWSNLTAGITGRTRTDEAMKQVFSLSTKKVFDETLTWMKQQQAATRPASH